jgi:hypothetical protein
MPTAQSVVYCAPDTRAYMATTIISNGVKTVTPSNFDGSAPVAHGMKFAGPDPALTETFIDLISGERFAKITVAQAAELDPDIVFAGCGSVVGLFTQVFPPDEVEETTDPETGEVVSSPKKKAKKKAA